MTKILRNFTDVPEYGSIFVMTVTALTEGRHGFRFAEVAIICLQAMRSFDGLLSKDDRFE